MSFDALARAANLRDLGGLPGADGRRVRRRVLYRSGELAALGTKERRALDRLGVRTVIDLRTDAEVQRRGATPEPPGGRVIRLPMDSGDLTSSILPLVMRGRFDAVPPDLLVQVNRTLVRDAQASFRAVFDVLLDARRGPVLFHCTHGKDRTGVLAAVVLLALDVPWSAVLADYQRSNELRTLQHRRQRAAVRLLARWLGGRPWREPDVRSVERLFDVVPENLEAAREEMRALAGDVDGFLEDACALSPSRRAALREAWLDEAR